MAENFFGISDTGRVRDNNEDTFIVEHVLNDEYILACVIDGVGGYEGGEVAAAIAKEAILQRFDKPVTNVIATLKEALVAVNHNIQAEKQKKKDKSQMACVLTLALVSTKANKFQYAHVGDTRLYLLRDHSLVKITKDHSFVGFLEDSGRLTEEQAMKHPKRNEINKALGFDAQIETGNDYIETGESPFLPGDILLLCSDGLTDMVNNSEMTSILVSPASITEKGKELVDAANKKGGRDNITVVLVHHEGARVTQEATRPVSTVKRNDTVNSETSVIKNDAQPASIKNNEPKKSGNKYLTRILFILCLVLLAAFLWSMYYGRKPVAEQQTNPVSNVVNDDQERVNRNSSEQKLRDSLQRAGFNPLFISDSLFGTSVTLTDSIYIQQDSIYIQGSNGFTITADPSYRGAAIVLAPTTKWIVLDNITFENFDVAILAQNKNVHLRNVRFKNCRLPLTYQFAFPNNSNVNGGIRDSAIFIIDTLHKTL